MKGKTEITVPSPTVEYLGTEDSPDFALSHFSIVVAQPVEELTYAPDDSVVGVWYKFRITETISQKPPFPTPLPSDPPAEMLPVNDDEFLIFKYGGTLSVDGVTVTMTDAGLPPFAKGRMYLLLISRNLGGVATLWAGPSGAFAVTPEGNTEPVNKEPHPIKEVMRDRFNNSTARLKQLLKSH